jgi:hypothetical protein
MGEVSDEGTSTCRSCQAEILWVVTTNGRRMPLDVEPDPVNGRFVKTRVEGEDKIVRFVKDKDLAENTKTLYSSHFQTCPNAREHRR